MSKPELFDFAARPGEQYAFVFDLPRADQIQLLRDAVLRLSSGEVFDEQIEKELWDISCNIHTILDRIQFDSRERNRSLAPKRATRPQTSTLEDLI